MTTRIKLTLAASMYSCTPSERIAEMSRLSTTENIADANYHRVSCCWCGHFLTCLFFSVLFSTF